MRKTHKMT